MEYIDAEGVGGEAAGDAARPVVGVGEAYKQAVRNSDTDERFPQAEHSVLPVPEGDLLEIESVPFNRLRRERTSRQ